MPTALQVTNIQPNGSGIRIKVHGLKKILKISSRGFILIRHDTISTDELRVGDEILAYGFDILPIKLYNKRDRRVKS